MVRRAYYNEIDPKAAAWLRELMAAGEIMEGEVDERSIAEVRPEDLRGFVRCHFFAGVGFRDLALRWAQWPADRQVWTGSCPCQPFSCAGAGNGADDERHLWPVFADIIRACRPAVVFGEQVASAAVVGKVGRGAEKPTVPVWLDGVRADMEAAGYAFGASVLGAHSVGAPHRRQRVYWVADGSFNANTRGRAKGDAVSRCPATGVGVRVPACRPSDAECKRTGRGFEAETGPYNSGLILAGELEAATRENLTSCWPSDAEHAERRTHGCGHDEHGRNGQDGGRSEAHGESGALREVGGPSDAELPDRGTEQQQGEPGSRRRGLGGSGELGGASDVCGGAGQPWADYRVHRYLDGKDRRIPTEPRLFPLADDRHPYHRGRVGLLRGAGNGIIPALAAEFIGAWIECSDGKQGVEPW